MTIELPIKLTDEDKEIKGIDRLYPIIEESFRLKDMLTTLEIDSEDALAVANAKAVDAKKLAKQVQSLRKDITSPMDKQKKLVIDIEKRILTPLNDGIEDLTQKIIKYQNLLEEIKEKEIAKLETKKDGIDEWKEKLKALELKIYKSIDIKTEVADLQTVAIKAIFAKAGTAALQLLVKDANSSDITELAALTKNRCMRYGKAKKIALEGGEDETSMLRSVLEQEMEDSLLLISNAETVAVTSAIKSTESKKSIASIRKSFKYDIDDISKVPEKFTKTIIDEDAVKAFIKEHKDTLENIIKIDPNKVISGLTFRVEQTHVGR